MVALLCGRVLSERALRLLLDEVRSLKVCLPWRFQYFGPFEVIFWIC